MGHPDRLAAEEVRAIEICRGIQRKCRNVMRELDEVTDIGAPPARAHGEEDSIVEVLEPVRGRVKTLEDLSEKAAKAAC